MNLEIEKAENGYIASWWEIIEDEHVKKQMVFEETEAWNDTCEVTGELRSIEALLYFVVEYFGMIGSKHDKHRIRVSIEHQHEDNTD